MENVKITENDVKNILTELWKECQSENANYKLILAKAYTLGEHVKELELKENLHTFFNENTQSKNDERD